MKMKSEESKIDDQRESQCRMKKQRSAAEGKANEECTEADDGDERESPRIDRELKENGTQADDIGEKKLFTHFKH